MDKSTTGKLAEVLATIDNTQDMEKFMEQPKVTDSFKTFPEYYRSLPRVKETTDSALIELSGIERSYYYQIMKGKRHPSRDKILRLCIGPLYPKSRRDIIITVAINQSTTVIDTNLLLFEYGEKALE